MIFAPFDSADISALKNIKKSLSKKENSPTSEKSVRIRNIDCSSPKSEKFVYYSSPKSEKTVYCSSPKSKKIVYGRSPKLEKIVKQVSINMNFL